MESGQLKRVFKHDKKLLNDIDPSLTEHEILDVYSNQYPELVNANVEGPIINQEKGEAVYTFSSSIGTKG